MSKRISELAPLSTFSGNELIPIVKNLTNMITTPKGLGDYLSNAVDVARMGAVGDGVTDDTTAFQLAIAKCVAERRSLFIPPASNHYKITSRLALNAAHSGLRIFGAGSLSWIKQYGAGDDCAVIISDGADNISVSNLCLTPGLSWSGYTNGFALDLRNGKGFSIRSVELTQHKRGIKLQNATEFRIDGVYAHDSVVVNTVDTNKTSGFDVALFNNLTNGVVTNVVSKNGCGIGVGLQTTDGAGYTQKNVAVSNIVVDGQGAYGIMFYSFHTAHATPIVDTMVNITLNNFVVQNVYGALLDADTNNYPFGAGVYNQGYEGLQVSNGSISNCNVNTDTELLAPGAYGSTNVRDQSISNLNISGTKWYGMYIADPNAIGPAGAVTTVSNVHIHGGTSGYDQLRIVSMPRVKMEKLILDSSVGRVASISGLVTAYHTFRDLTILSPAASGFTINAGNVDIEGIDVGNIPSGQAGILYNATGAFTVRGGRMQAGGTAIYIGATVTHADVRGVVFTGFGTDININAPTKGIYENIFLSPDGPRISGAYGIEPAITGALPNVRNMALVQKSDGVDITNIVGLPVGQQVTIRATADFTLKHNANGDNGALSLTRGTDLKVRNGESIALVAAAFVNGTSGSGFKVVVRPVGPVSKTQVVPSTGIALTTAQTGTTLTNEGSSTTAIFNLPVAEAGLEFSFVCQNAAGVRLLAMPGNTIRNQSAVSSSGGTMDTTTQGSCVSIKAINATEWLATSIIGSWSLS